MELVMPCSKLGILEQHRVDLLMQTIPRLFLARDLHVRNMLGHRGFPLGQFLIAAIQAQAQGKAHGPTDIQAGDRVMGQGIGAIAVVVVPVHVVEETAHMFTQGIVNRDDRLASALARGCGRLPPEPDAASLDCGLPPGRRRAEA